MLRRLGFLVLLLCASSSASAALGLPDTTARFGIAPAFSNLKIIDPAGDTFAANVAQPFRLFYTDWLQGGYRYWLEGYYIEATLSADESHIGQYFRQAGGQASIQYNVTLNSYFKPWIGMGMDFSMGRYTLRYTKDVDGYLLKTYANRNQVTAALLFSLASEWEVRKDWFVGGSLLRRVSLNNTLSESSLSVILMKRY